MRMHQLILPALVVAGLLLSTTWMGRGLAVAGPGIGAPNDVKPLMDEKLKLAQDLLRALAMEDHDQVARSANALVTLTKQGEWKRIQEPLYLVHSDNFRRAAMRVAAAGFDRNVDAATLGYMQMTMACMTCHKAVRKQGEANVQRDGAEEPAVALALESVR